MRSKSILFLSCAAVAFSMGSVAYADSRDHRGSRGDNRGHRQESRRDDRGWRDDHGRRDDRGRSWDSRGHRVWSHAYPRTHFYVGHRPPPMRFEYRPFRPSSRHYWVPGCWRWRAGYTNWVWVNGYWDLPPYENYVYVEPRYVDQGGRVVYVEGGWSEPSYARDGEASGTVLGAVAGGIIGHQSHNTGAGVVLGAVVGNIIGREADKDAAEKRALAQQRVAQAQVEPSNQPVAPVVGGTEQSADPELAAAQERAREAKAKLAEAKRAREAADARTAAIKKANDEAAAAEAELRTVNP